MTSTRLSALLQRPVVRRVLAACGSNAYAQATTIAMQLASLPLFLSRWDLATYGLWLVLSALPAYLAMADAGMLAAAGNRMTMLLADGQARQATRAFQSATAFVLGIGALALPLVIAAAWWWPSDAGTNARVAVMLLSAGVVTALVGGLPEAVYKATQRWALGAALANTTRLLEWGGSIAGLWWGGDFVSVALGALLARAACTAAMVLHARLTTPALRWGVRDASRDEVRRCIAPALSFMAFPAANALNFQGMTLVCAAALGPAATVVFNTYRTLARVTVQATAVFSLALWPEFSRLYGQRRFDALALAYRRSRRIGLALAAAAGVVVFAVAPWVLAAWSGGRIGFDPALMAAAMVYAATASAWHVSRVLLMSTNEHVGLALPCLALSLLALPLAWALAQGAGLVGIVGAMLALELALLALCGWLARRLLLAPAPSETTMGAPA